MKYILVLPLLLLSTHTLGQKSMNDLTARQRAALQRFLAQHPEYRFMPESAFAPDTLRAAREEWDFGKAFRPYYRAGDFNADGLPDFAVILSSDAKAGDPGSTMHAVIFNGIKGSGYRVAHIESLESSPALFLGESAGGLYAGVMETDAALCFTPSGNGYVGTACGQD
jgi:hypothetical protein